MSRLEQMREQRHEQGRRFTKKALADAAGVSVPTYNKLEREPGRITREQAERLAAYIGCDVEDVFLDGEVK